MSNKRFTYIFNILLICSNLFIYPTYAIKNIKYLGGKIIRDEKNERDKKDEKDKRNEKDEKDKRDKKDKKDD